MAMTSTFIEGIDLVEAECLKSTIALMCGEKAPEACHRTLLVGHHLYCHRRGHNLRHILPGQPDPESPHSPEWLMWQHRLDDPEQAVDAQSAQAAYRRRNCPNPRKDSNQSGTARINFRPNHPCRQSRCRVQDTP